MAAITVTDLYKVFGKNPCRAIPLLNKGKTKDEFLKKTGLTAELNKTQITRKFNTNFVEDFVTNCGITAYAKIYGFIRITGCFPALRAKRFLGSEISRLSSQIFMKWVLPHIKLLLSPQPLR